MAQLQLKHAGDRGAVVDAIRKVINYEQLTSLATSTGLTAAKFDGAHYAEIQAEGDNIRFREDGSTTAPTTSVGTILFDGQTKRFLVGLADVRFIEINGSGKLNITYFQLL